MNIDNIYGEILPDRIDLNSDQEKSYPPQLIITFDSIATPSLGTFTMMVRKHILECNKLNLNPDIVLNFCIDTTDFSTNEKYLMRYIAISEYLLDIQKQIQGLTISISMRGYLLTCMIPLLYIGVPVKVSEATLIETYSEGLFKILSGVLETMIEKLSGKKIERPFKMDKNKMLQSKLIIQ
jgi:hypothetical protein